MCSVVHGLAATGDRKESSVDAGRSLTVQLLLCWDVKLNFARMVSVNAERTGDTAALNGVRGLSMALVILGHTLLWMGDTGFINLSAVYPNKGAFSLYTFQVTLDTPGVRHGCHPSALTPSHVTCVDSPPPLPILLLSKQIIPSAEFAVDSFFMMSAFLVTIGIVNRLAAGKRLNVPLLYLHRYVRLTPVYAFAMVVFTYVAPHLSSGPYWSEMTVPVCDTYGWTNMLYVNNVIPFEGTMERMCVAWSWYLANDMQFFLVTPPLLLLYNKHKIAALVVMAVAMLASMFTLLGHAYSSKVFAMYDLTGTHDFGNNGDIYVRPWYRIPAYLVGVFGGILWVQYKGVLLAYFKERRDRKQRRERLLVRWAVFLGVAALLLTIFYSSQSFYAGEMWSLDRLAAYTAFTKPTWTVGLMVLCVLWFTNPRDPIAKFLAAPFWCVRECVTACLGAARAATRTRGIMRGWVRARRWLSSAQAVFRCVFLFLA